MIYGNVKSYLDNEVKKPILEALEEGGTYEEVSTKVMEVVDYICNKYAEINATALWYETKVPFKQFDFQEYSKFMIEKMKELNED